MLLCTIKLFNKSFKEHQEKSRTIDAGSFKGGLADSSEESTKYHTLAHLLLATLQEIYGKEVIQKGCNITSERIRFDFNLDHKMTDEELKYLEDLLVLSDSVLFEENRSFAINLDCDCHNQHWKSKKDNR